MFVREYFLNSIQETKDLIRKRIESTAEFTFEDERRQGYVEGALDFGEQIELMIPDEKEGLRLQCLRDLDDKRHDIISLWETVIERTAYFQVEFEIAVRLTFIIALLSFLFSVYAVAITFGIITAFFFVVSIIPGLFQLVMFIVTGSGFISDKLLVAYHKYGRIEAALFFADYRRITQAKERQRTWVYTTSHKNPPPE